MANIVDMERNSFIANVNLLVRKLTLLLEINEKFSTEDVADLARLARLDVEVLIEDLQKGDTSVLVQITHRLSELIELYEKYPEYKQVADLYASLYNSLEMLSNIDASLTKLVGEGSIYDNLDKLIEIHGNLDNLPDTMRTILEATQQAIDYVNELKSLQISVSSIPNGYPANSTYDSSTGILYLQIPEGSRGKEGKEGLSAYQVAVNNGFIGSVSDWLNSFGGVPGASAYDLAVEKGFEGTEEEWLESLKGDKGDSVTLDIAEIGKPGLIAPDGETTFVDLQTGELHVEVGPSVTFDGVTIQQDSTTGDHYVPAASVTQPGIVQIGDGIQVDGNGVISVQMTTVVSTPSVEFPAHVGIGYSYIGTFTAKTSASGAAISYFEVSFDNEPIVQLEAINGIASSSFAVTGLQGVGTLKVIAYDTLNNSSYAATHTFQKSNVTITAPAISFPASGSVDISITPVINIDPAQINGVTGIPSITAVQIATDDQFTTVVAEHDGGYITSYQVPSLAVGTRFYVRARHGFEIYGMSDWGTVTIFDTIHAAVTAPVIFTPVDGATDVLLNPMISISAFTNVGPTDTPTATNVQIATDSEFTNIIDVYDGSYIVDYSPTTSLSILTQYYIRVRHQGELWGWSAWSKTNAFTTIDVYLSAPVIRYPVDGWDDISILSSIRREENIIVEQDIIDGQVQIAADASFEEVIVEAASTGTGTSALSTLGIGSDMLCYARWRLQGSITGWTDWSNVVSFRTASFGVNEDILKTASGNMKPPVNGFYDAIIIAGGGGAGASINGPNGGAVCAGSGGGGSAARVLATELTTNDTITYTIGAGGAAGTGTTANATACGKPGGGSKMIIKGQTYSGAGGGGGSNAYGPVARKHGGCGGGGGTGDVTGGTATPTTESAGKGGDGGGTGGGTGSDSSSSTLGLSGASGTNSGLGGLKGSGGTYNISGSKGGSPNVTISLPTSQNTDKKYGAGGDSGRNINTSSLTAVVGNAGDPGVFQLKRVAVSDTPQIVYPDNGAIDVPLSLTVEVWMPSTLQGVETDTIRQSSIRYRVAGESTWTYIYKYWPEPDDNMFEITDLLPNTEYQLVATVYWCQALTSSTPTLTFTTGPE